MELCSVQTGCKEPVCPAVPFLSARTGLHFLPIYKTISSRASFGINYQTSKGSEGKKFVRAKRSGVGESWGVLKKEGRKNKKGNQSQFPRERNAEMKNSWRTKFYLDVDRGAIIRVLSSRSGCSAKRRQEATRPQASARRLPSAAGRGWQTAPNAAAH